MKKRERDIEKIAAAIKRCVEQFTAPVDLYIHGEAYNRWKEAHPHWYNDHQGPHWHETPESKDELVDYKIIAEAVVDALRDKG